MSAAAAAAVVVSAGGGVRSASSQAGMMLGRFASAWPRAGTAAGASAAAASVATRAICSISSRTVAGSRASPPAAAAAAGGGSASRGLKLAWSAPGVHARAASSGSERPHRQHFRLVCSDDVRVLPGQVRVEGRRHASADLSSRQMRFIEFDLTGKQMLVSGCDVPV